MSAPAIPRILTIAGSDSGGGAGIQADLKTITALGGFGMSAITAITAQNTQGVQDVWPMPVEAVLTQMGSVVADIGVDGIKTGMIPSLQHVEAIAEKCTQIGVNVIVVDPVIIASSGARLAERKTIGAVLSTLIPLASLVTPNSLEAEHLTGVAVETPSGQHRAAEALMKAGAGAALVKGGHIEGEDIIDILHTQSGEFTLPTPRIFSRNTHGTGCTLASAIATLLATPTPTPLQVDMAQIITRAQDYVARAIHAAPNFGSGPHGPMNHGVILGENR